MAYRVAGLALKAQQPRADHGIAHRINTRNEPVKSANALGPLGVLCDAGPATPASKPRRPDMNIIVAFALITLSLLTMIAAPASAFDSKEFREQQDRLPY